MFLSHSSVTESHFCFPRPQTHFILQLVESLWSIDTVDTHTHVRGFVFTTGRSELLLRVRVMKEGGAVGETCPGAAVRFQGSVPCGRSVTWFGLLSPLSSGFRCSRLCSADVSARWLLIAVTLTSDIHF